MNKKIELSVVCPVYQAANTIDSLVLQLQNNLKEITPNFEIILVDDGSKDDSWNKIVENREKFKEVSGIKLSRNFGQQYAIQAGFDQSRGDYVLTLDCDLQDPPEYIKNLFSKIKEGYEIVVAKKINRKDKFFQTLSSKVFNKIIKTLSDFKIEEATSNYAIYSRRVIEAIDQFQDNIRYYPMLRKYVGFDIAYIEIEQSQRHTGKSSYTFWKKFQLALTTILNFSEKPLKFVIFLGILFASISIMTTLILVIFYFFGNYVVKGWASLALLIIFFSGIIIMVLGMIGLYIGKIFESVKNRPTYIIQEKIANE